MDPIFTIENLITFITLSGLEVVLGIDNVIFIAVLTYNIPKKARLKIQFFGIGLAIILRIAMLFGVSWLMGLTKTICEFHGMAFSGKALLLIAGGAFLIIKSGIEFAKILHLGSYKASSESSSHAASKHLNAILQIVFVDLVLSFDSVIVAVGMVNKLYLIIPAIFVAMVAMLVSADAIGRFLHSNPSIKVLGLAFVFIIGLALMLDGLSFTIPKSYLYTAMFFSLFVELINIRVRKLKSH
jgi:predicted tellurium resistance membrane protein TerC